MVEVDQIIARQELSFAEKITPSLLLLTEENEELYDMARKGLYYAYKQEFCTPSEKLSYFKQIKKLKLKCDDWNASHINKAT